MVILTPTSIIHASVSQAVQWNLLVDEEANKLTNQEVNRSWNFHDYLFFLFSLCLSVGKEIISLNCHIHVFIFVEHVLT